MPIKIIAIGKKHESWVTDGIQRYEKRLQRPFNVEWVLLPHSSLQGDRARQEESERIYSRIVDDDYVVLLDERGDLMGSPALSSALQSRLDRSQQVTMVIGGAYGVDTEVRRRADLVWSLSLLVFPHQLVRLMLMEQLYRAQEIARSGAYHHE